MSELEAVFSPAGALAKVLPGWRSRPQQIQMAEAVEAAIKSNGVLLAEAGTGTGKTLAYLIPALLSGGKVVVSTGTKALQDQLFHRDLPAARRALASPVAVALLKGRANYICRYHLERNLSDGRFAHKDDVIWLRKISRFAETTKSGDRAEAEGIPEDASAWHYAVSSRDTCLGSDCEYHKDDCFVMQARKAAMEAEVVVVNHHLFFADLWLKDEGVAELLPACNTVILDEAHQLADTATQFFGENISTAQLLELASDTKKLAAVHAADFPVLRESAELMGKAARDLRLVFPLNPVKATEKEIGERFEAWADALKTLHTALEELTALLLAQAERDAELKNAHERARALLAGLINWQTDDAPDTPRVRWLETTLSSLILHITPLSIGALFGGKLAERAQAWVLTSATLSVGGDFTHLRARLGIAADAATLSVESPFDYPRQGVLYVPTGLPAPNTPDFTRAVVDAALPVLELSQGRAFLLFTSLRALEAARGFLTEAFQERGWDWPLFVQGDAPKNRLLQHFQTSGNGVLLGSQSFWEGVDVPGDALSVVVIDKLPFQPPDDPVVAARISDAEKNGRSAFASIQLPHAAISLKQGAGRLIRTESDRGVLVICDTRLADKPYGKTLLRALPNMTRTRKLDIVARFFAAQAKAAA